MKKLVLLLTLCLAFSCLAACQQNPMPVTTEATTEAATEDTTEVTTEATTIATTQSLLTGPQFLDLVGTWQRTHTEVEGDRNPNKNATITITGEENLVITYTDLEFPDSNFTQKALTFQEGTLYTECGNDNWYAQVDPVGVYRYRLTLLDDGALLLQCRFDFDGHPMVSYQWFVRSQ